MGYVLLNNQGKELKISKKTAQDFFGCTGEVKKIDKPAGRITLKHAEIKAYDMPGMTGAYKVQDPSMLDKVQVGDRVQFSLDRVNSVYTITKIDVQK